MYRTIFIRADINIWMYVIYVYVVLVNDSKLLAFYRWLPIFWKASVKRSEVMPC